MSLSAVTEYVKAASLELHKRFKIEEPIPRFIVELEKQHAPYVKDYKAALVKANHLWWDTLYSAQWQVFRDLGVALVSAEGSRRLFALNSFRRERFGEHNVLALEGSALTAMMALGFLAHAVARPFADANEEAYQALKPMDSLEIAWMQDKIPYLKTEKSRINEAICQISSTAQGLAAQHELLINEGQKITKLQNAFETFIAERTGAMVAVVRI